MSLGLDRTAQRDTGNFRVQLTRPHASSPSRVTENFESHPPKIMAHIADMEACYDALMGTPTKRAPTQRLGSAKRSSKTPGDRFIPNRRAMDLNVSHFELTRGDAENANASPAKEEYKKELAAKLNMAASNKVLAFSNKAPKPEEGHQNSLRALYSQNREAGLAPKKYTRHIPQAPERILDAPEMLDDYYLNLLDWGRNNVLSVALGGSIYLWNASDGSIQELMQAPGETHVTSVSWMQEETTWPSAPPTTRSSSGTPTSSSRCARWTATARASRRSRGTTTCSRQAGATRRWCTTTCAWRSTRWASSGPHPGGVRPALVAVGHAARLGRQRQPAQRVGRPVRVERDARDGPGAVPAGRAPGGGQGARVVSVAAQPARLGRRHRRPHHQVLELDLGRHGQQRGHQVAGALTLAQALTLTLTLVRAAMARMGVRGRASG